jgi:GT2 family glycosyltransferase
VAQGLSIIIVNYNGEIFLEKCVRSFSDFLVEKSIGHEFLIIDNASSDGSVALIKELCKEFTTIKPFFSDINHGFSKANNLMADEATFDTLVLLNNDTLTIDISELCALVKSGEIDENTVYTCTILNSDYSIQKNTFNYPRLFNVAIEVFLVKKLIFNLYKALFKSKLVIKDGYYSGCYLVLNKALFNKSGQFDSAFFFYHEECDLFLRLEHIGIEKKILGDQIIHYGSGSAAISDFSFKNYYVNLARLLIKHGYGSEGFIKTIFLCSFKFRMALLWLGIKIPYSPFSHVYGKNKGIAVANKHVIKLHQDTLEAIQSIPYLIPIKN